MSEFDDHGSCGCGCGCHDTAPIPDDLPDWASADDEAVVCPCQGVTKGQVRRAIETGAYTLALVKVMTGAGRGNDCAELNPLGRSCEADIEELIRLFLAPSGRPALRGQPGRTE